MSTVLIFLIVIVVLVVAHELGHFFVAKFFGVRVDEFGVGYPPRAGKLFTWKQTLFTLNWLPFGGFVRIFGEEGTEETSGSFAHKSMGKRVFIIAAGILANMLLAVVLYSISFGVGFLASPTDFPGSISNAPARMMITDVLPGSPAANARLKSGDIIERLSVAPNESIDPKNVNDVVDFVHSHGDKEIILSVRRKEGKDEAGGTVGITPHIVSGETNPSIGVQLAEVAKIRLPFFAAIKEAFVYTGQEFVAIIRGIGVLIGSAFHGERGQLTNVSGPVGIAKMAGQAYSFGLSAFLAFVAVISVNLAVINLLPFPALDGGRLIMELFARGGRSRIPKRVVAIVNQVGFLILILLMLLVTYHDIYRLFA